MEQKHIDMFSNNLIHLDLTFFSGEKTEKATPKKKNDARKKGQVAKSQEVGTAFLFLTIFVALSVFAPWMLRQLISMYYLNFSMVINIDNFFLDRARVVTHIYSMFASTLLIVAPVSLVAFVVGFIANLMQVGWKPSPEALKPKFSNLNPISGFKKMFSMKLLVDLVKNLLKFGVIFYAIYSILMDHIDIIPALIHLELMEAVAMLSGLAVAMGIRVGMFFIFIAAADYAYTVFKHAKDLRMSKQDQKDEHKQSEGDPQIKGKIKQRMREAAMKRMMSDVPSADVIITNPTHYAVAIKYDKSKGLAPVVVAKGADLVAKRIRDVATENNVQLVENKPLARTLYASVDIGREIPPELYQAVAEILAYVYKLKNII